MTDYQRELDLAAGKLKKQQTWTIVCHENPDGDTLGCGLALYALGKRLGKQVRLMGHDEVPVRYAFLPCSDEYEALERIPAEAKDSLIVSVDASTLSRSLPGLEEILEVCRDSVNFDHHGDDTRFCATNVVSDKASATAEIIMDLIEAAGWELQKPEAISLYTALTTDNGSFRFNSTSPHSHFCAAKLLAAGVDPSYVDDCVSENLSASEVKLWGLAYSRAETFAEGRIAMFWLEKKDFDDAASNGSSVDGLVNMLLRIRGVKIALFLSEVWGVNKVSIRTRKPYSARALASLFGGGGHALAAGAKVSGTFKEALATVRATAEKYAADWNPAGK